jgi:cbb3-type cytochrome oxidase subunit 1
VKIGIALSIITLALAGLTQGAMLLNSKVGFGEIAASTRTYLLVNTAAQFVLLASNLLLLVNFWRSALSCCGAASNAEGSAS